MLAVKIQNLFLDTSPWLTGGRGSSFGGFFASFISSFTHPSLHDLVLFLSMKLLLCLGGCEVGLAFQNHTSWIVAARASSWGRDLWEWGHDQSKPIDYAPQEFTVSWLTGLQLAQSQAGKGQPQDQC